MAQLRWKLIQLDSFDSYRSRPFYDIGKFHNTLWQAYGPYAQWHIDRRTPIEKASKVIVAVCLCVASYALWIVTK